MCERSLFTANGGKHQTGAKNMFKESKIRILQLGFSILHFWTYVDETAHVSFLAGVHKTNILHDGGSLQTSVRIPLWSV